MDRLRLTDDDIEKANAASQRQTDLLRIQAADLPPEKPLVVETAVIRLTEADIAVSNTTTPDIHLFETNMWQLVNQARQDHRLPRLMGTHILHWHEGLAAVARTHSLDMLNRHYIEHTSPDRVTAGRRIQRAGINYLACGENIGVLYGEDSQTINGVQEIHNAFMDQSRGKVNNHRGNCLNPFWTHVGIGIVWSPHGALIATQNFISLFPK